ncbi:MAG TPA: YciI family protein [Gammaproteobacteria bacterium]|nr:YciI family protein [Gammaproteobacteria bacterium]
MQYALFIYADPSGFEKATPEQREQGMAAYTAYTQALKQAGVWQGSNRLRPVSDSTTVRVTNGKPQVLNGPYVDTKEQLGGYYLIDVPDLDSALKWAARCPGASHGTVEVRPVWS